MTTAAPPPPPEPPVEPSGAAGVAPGGALASLRRRLDGRLGGGSLTGRFSLASFLLLLGTLAWRVPSAISTILLGRILGPQGFGEFAMVNSTVQLFAESAGVRLGAMSAKYVAEHRLSDPVRAARILRLSLVVSFGFCLLAAVMLALLAPWLASTGLSRPELALGLTLGALLLFFLVAASVQEFALTGFQNFAAVARVGALRGAATPLLCLPLAWWWGVNGAIIGLAGVAALAFATLAVLLARERRAAGFPRRIPAADLVPELPVLWTYALPGVLTGVLVTATMWAGRVLLARQEAGYEQLGLFEAANQWRTLILFLPAVMARAVLPLLAESFGRSGGEDFRQALHLQVRSVAMVTIPLVLFAVGGGDVLAWIFGPRFRATGAVIPVVMAAVFFFALNHSVRQAFDGSGRRWINLGMYLLWAVMFLAACWRWVPAHGAMGLAVAGLLAEAGLFLVQAGYVERRLAPRALLPLLPMLGAFTFAIGLQYLAFWRLPTAGSLAVALLLAGLSGWPLLRRLLGR